MFAGVTQRSSALRLFALVGGLAIALGAMFSAAQAEMVGQYDITDVADSTEDGFDPFSFGCTSINSQGDVAFRAGRAAPDGFNTIPGIYRVNAPDGSLTTIVEDEKRFQTIGTNPSMNDLGEVSFAARLDARDKQTGDHIEAILRGDQEFVEEIVTGSGGPLTTVADTRGAYSFFGFRPPSLNKAGDVAFHATLDDFSTSGIFVGPDPLEDRVIATGDTLDGSTIQSLTFCEVGLSDSGELAFAAQLEDPNTLEDFRMAVFRATPVP